MTPKPGQLDIYSDQHWIGSLYDSTPPAFEYSTLWLRTPGATALAAIPLQHGRQASVEVQAYFENLLPEGEIRSYIAEQNKASTLFSMLAAVAGDTAGAFVLVPGGERPEPPRYQPTTWPELARRLAGTSAAAIDLQGKRARISLAGAQDKAGIAIFEDGLPQFPQGTAPSTHILKPDIRRLEKVWHSAANEAIVMRTASHCGLPTADVFYEPSTQSCVVRRFDRVLLPDRGMSRLVQYDLCQLAGTLSERKYEKEGGPGIAACAALIRRYSTQPAADLIRFVQWIFFNLCTGNNDSHAKNLSLYWLPDGRVALTPFYDLMNTRMYPGLSREFAFAVGGETRPGSVGRRHVFAMAAELSMQPRFLLAQASALAKRLPGALDKAMADVSPSLSDGARTLALRLRSNVLSTTTKLVARLAD